MVAAIGSLVGGCGNDTVLRIRVDGAQPPPAALRVTLAADGVNLAPRILAPVTLPGVLVIDHLPATAVRACVAIDGLDASGARSSAGSATVTLAPGATTLASVRLGDPRADAGCASGADAGVGAPTDLAASVDGGTPDGAVAICPATALFCDDFEGGDLTRWTQQNIKLATGSLAVQSATVAHGGFALRARASGTPLQDTFAEVEKDFTPTAPPLALRANIFTPAPLTAFTMTVALYDATTHGFAIGGDDAASWVVTEDQAAAPDHHSDMVPVDAGRWHCVELVIDAAGSVTFFVDNRTLSGPFARASAVAYSTFFVGITRTIRLDNELFVDDVAIGPTRLYCP